jgi:hypothetical protein
LPEQTAGKLSIRHREWKAGHVVPLVDLREAMMTGVKPEHVKLAEPRRLHVLYEEDVGTWMTDEPRELRQMDEAVALCHPRGHVLVGGLGLGILARRVQRPGVKSVTVVEKNPDVIRLCGDGLHVIEEDIHKFLWRGLADYDTYMLDTWQGTNEGTWWQTVMPLRRAIANRYGRRRVWCWAENIMRGQVRRAIQLHTMNDCGPGWYYRIFTGEEMTPRRVEYFLRWVGFPKWEKEWGKRVDHYGRWERKERGRLAAARRRRAEEPDRDPMEEAKRHARTGKSHDTETAGGDHPGAGDATP